MIYIGVYGQNASYDISIRIDRVYFDSLVYTLITIIHSKMKL